MRNPNLSLAVLCLAMLPETTAAQIQSVPVYASNGGGGIALPPLVRREEDLIHVALRDPIQAGGVVYMRSPDAGRSWTLPIVLAASHWSSGVLASAGARVYVATDVAFHASGDGGVSWHSTANTSGLAVASAVAEGANCHVLLYRSPTSSGSHPVAYVRTADGGATWSSPVVIGMSPSILSPGMVVDGSAVHVHWSDNVLTNYQSSTDGGVTWRAAPALLGSAPALGEGLAVSGNFVHIVRGTHAVEYVRSVDGGATWQAAVTIPGTAYGDALAVSGSDVHVLLWGAFGSNTLSVASSLDDGSTWTLSALSSNWPNGAAITASGSSVCVAWHGAATGAAWIAMSASRGASWQASPGSCQSFDPTTIDIALDPPFVAVRWLPRGWLGPALAWWPVALDVSADLGASWHLQQVFGGTFSSGPTAFAASSDGCGLLWSDGATLSGGPVQPTNLHYGTIYGHEHYGQGTPGSGGVAPALQPSGRPVIGSALTVTMSGVRGGALSLIGASLVGEASVPLGSGQLLLASPTLALWGVASGGAGLPGAGSFSLPLSIPNSPALRRSRIWFQGFVLDPGVLDGFSSTAGLKLLVL